VLALLQPKRQRAEQESASAPDNVVQLSGWQRRRQQAGRWIGQHAALAAGIALVIGFTGGQFLDTGSTLGNSGEPAATLMAINMDAGVSDALDTTPSGEPQRINDNTSMLSRFSFVDRQSRHCRQFVLESGSSTSENIACRTGPNWQLVASARVTSAGAGEYQTASGGSLLDSTLDIMMPGNALSLEEENALIGTRWQ